MSRKRMLADVEAILEGMPGMLASDSVVWLLGYLVSSEAVNPMGWRRAMVALGEEYPERQAMLDAYMRPAPPVLQVVPAQREEPGPRTCAACGRKGAHESWCGLD